VDKAKLKLLDSSAISLSGLCLLHCVLTTLIIPVFPMIASSFIADEMVHLWLFLLACPLSVFALSIGWRLHGKIRFFLMGMLGLSLMGGALIHGISEAWETTLTTSGVIVLALSHFGNYGLNRRSKESKNIQGAHA